MTLEATRPAANSTSPGEAGWVDVRDLCFTYPDGFEALKGLTFTLAKGEKAALIGPNGAGKSTLMLHLNGINMPAAGSVSVGGLAVSRQNIGKIRAEVGLVFQDPDDQLFSPTVYEDVAFGPIHMGLAKDEVDRRVTEALAAVGLPGFGGRQPFHLSIGQRKRAALATVLSMSPSLLVLDEPSAGLDPRGRRELINLLRGLEQTMLVSTHDMKLVAEVFPRTLIVDEGRLVADGATAELLGDKELLERHGLEQP